MVTRSLLIVLALFWLPYGLAGQTESMPFYRFSLPEGLPDAYVFEVSEDYDHGIWLATRGGLVRMHGTYAEVFTVRDGLTRNDIRSVVHMPDGSAWIITSGPLARMYPDHTFRKPEHPLITNQRMLGGVADKKGNFWCVGADQIFCVSPSGSVEVLTRQRLGAKGNWAPEASWQGDGMLLSAENGLFHLTPEGIQHQWSGTLTDGTVSGARVPRVSALSPTLYVADGDGGLVYFDGELEPVVPPDDFWRNQTDFPILVEKTLSGALISLTRNNLDLYETESFSRTLKSIPVSSLEFQGGLLDRQGNLWLATPGDGAWMLSVHYLNQAVQELKWRDRFEPLIHGRITAVGQMGRSLLIGTDKGEVLRCGPDSSWLWQIESGAPVDQVLGGPGRWLARCGQTLVTAQAGHRDTRQLRMEGLKELNAASGQALMVNFRSRFHFRLPWDQVPALFGSDSPLDWMDAELDWVQVAYSRQALQTADGIFAVTLDEGITFPENTGNQDLLAGDPVLPGEYPDMVLWGRDTILAAAGPAGIEMFSGGKKVWPGPGDAPWPYGVVRKVLADSATRSIWALTNLGLVHLQGGLQHGDPVRGYLITQGEGFRTSEPTGLATVGDWVVMVKNNMICPMRVPDLSAIGETPDLDILCTRWPGSGCEPIWKGKKVIQRDSASLHIQLVNDLIFSPHNQVIEYRLKGDTWIPTENGLVALFALPVGEYALDARIRIGNQVILEKTGLVSFIIQPPFYQSWWFVFLASVMLVALIWAGMNLYYGETERRKLESVVRERTHSLDDTIRELEQKNEDLEQFAYIASHDLKSPLRGMIGHLQLIQRRMGGSLGEQANSSLEYAIGEAKRLFEMVNDLLDFASIGSERMEKKHVSLNRLIQSLEKSMIVQIRERGARIVYHDLPMVDIVPSQYEALFRNLIDNGIKFNESAEPTISIDFKATEGYWIFIVSDNGIGMDEQYLKKAFELYGRLNPDYPGTGIGLAICKRVVERHGGSIWYESQPGKGTSFLFSLPKPS